MFVGTHERSLDEKGRLSLPSSFRHQLGERCFVVNLGGSLGVYNEAGFAETMARLDDRVRAGEASQDDKRRLTASVSDLKVDKQGRVVLPAEHRTRASLEGEVVLIGALNRIEIYRPELWDEIDNVDDDGAARAGSWL